MAPSKDPISVRTTRLNNLLLGKGNGVIYKAASGRRSICGNNGFVVSSAVAETITRESLLDAFCLLYNECDKETLKKRDKNIAEFVNKYRSVIEETKQLRVNAEDFVAKSLIGKGYFGNVHLAVERQTGDVYAMKKIKKSVITTSQVKEERDIMSKRNSEWITNLQYAFQDNDYLYLVMEFVPGGDLLSLMNRHGPFDEDLARFYLAELTLALHSLHKMGYVHRDVKPENILIDRFGHIKLADFGNAAALNRDGHVLSFSPVGTPDYIAPELLQTISTYKINSSMHDVSCDYWSMGIIGYELVCEITPFHEDNVHETYNKILTHCEESNLHEIINFPPDLRISSNLKHLIKNLVTNPSKRLSYEEIRKHAYFDGVKWDSLRSQVPPIIPNLSSEDDVSNFEDSLRNKCRRNNSAKKSITTTMRSNDFSGKDLPFIGYSFVHLENKVCGEELPSDEIKTSKLNSKIKELQLKLKDKTDEITQMKQELVRAEQMAKVSDCQSKILDDAKEEMNKMKNTIKEKTVELAQYKMQIKTLQSSIKAKEERWEKEEATITEILRANRKKYEEAKLASEQRYEKMIAEKKNELIIAIQKLDDYQKDFESKNKECEHLRDGMQQYKEMIRQFKEQCQKDKEEFEKEKLKISSEYEEQLSELRGRLRKLDEKKSRLTMELIDVQNELQVSNKSTEEAKMVSAKNHEDVLQRLNREIEANNELHSQNAELMKRLSEAEKFAHDIQMENNRLERDLQVAECAKNLAESQILAEQSPYETAPGSLTELHAIEEQLRCDLEAAKENENAQKLRADKLQEIVGKLEEMVEKLQEHSGSPTKSQGRRSANTVGGMLEKQNEKLEEQLAKAREEMIVERQSARTANLALWKAEKKAEELELEKKSMQRRLELTDDRIKRFQNEKEEAQRLQKQVENEKKQLEERIQELRNEITSIKRDVTLEHRKYEKAEEERIKSKSEIIEHIAKVKKLEDNLSETRLQLQQAQKKNDACLLENRRLQKDLDEEHRKVASFDSNKSQLEIKLKSAEAKYERLKYACTITDKQLTEIEGLLLAEQSQNKANKEKIEATTLQIREREEDITKLKQEIEKNQKQKENCELKIRNLKEEIEELKRNYAMIQEKHSLQQTQLIEQTNKLYLQEEQSEVLSSETHNLHSINEKFEKEIFLLKEENARILSELFHAKEASYRLENELKEAVSQAKEYEMDLEELQEVLREKEEHFQQREIKAESTLVQYKKLIDYLQLKVEDLSQKKKKTLADVLFGSNGSTSNKKDQLSSAAIESSILYRTLQEELKREQQRCKSLQQQIDKLQGNEFGTLRSPLKLKELNGQEESSREKSPSKTASLKRNTLKKNLFNDKENTLQKPEKKSPESTASEKTLATLSTHQNSEPSYHRFELARQETKTEGAICVACEKPVLFTTSYWKCKSCKQAAHRACKGNVQPDCGNTNERKVQTNDILEIVPSASEYSGNETDTDTVSEDRFSYEAKLDDKTDSETNSLASYGGTLLYALEFELESAYEIEKDILLLGAACGLYSLNIPKKQLIQINGIDAALQIAISTKLSKTIMVGANGEVLYQCDLRQLQSRCHSTSSCVKSTLEASVINLPFANRTSTEKWQLVKISNEYEEATETVAIATTSSRIVILKYDIEMGKFKPVRALDTANPVTSITFTRHTAIVSSDKFYEIDLTTFGAEEFVDISDSSLLHTLGCHPVVAIKISTHEFLLCYTECGVFVDEFGCRSRPYDLSWSYLPTGFIYREPYLFISYFQSVQVIRLRRSFSKEISANQNNAHSDDDIDDINSFERASVNMYMPTLRSESGSRDVYVSVFDKATGQQLMYHLNAASMFKNTNSASQETLSSITTSITQSSLHTPDSG